ncbi:uncharacterized protein TNCV_3862071 [Trichonephila clavipes]|nr:uncharacterized protein TNCV_3862071 [Trichonephila clavipes]
MQSLNGLTLSALVLNLRQSRLSERMALRKGIRLNESDREESDESADVTDNIPVNQVTWTTTELAPSLLTTTPHQQEEISDLDRFNVHRCLTRRVFSVNGFDLVTRQGTIRYL